MGHSWCMHVWKWKGVCFANGIGETNWTCEPDTTATTVSLVVLAEPLGVAAALSEIRRFVIGTGETPLKTDTPPPKNFFTNRSLQGKSL